MTSRCSRLRVLAAAVAAAATAACGSTFPVDAGTGAPVVAGGVPGQEGSGPGEGDGGLSLSPSTGGTGVATDPDGAGDAFAGGSGTGATGTTSGSSGAGASPSSPSAPPSATGPETPANAGGQSGPRPAAAGQPGIDDERIVVGLTYTEDSTAANAALGAGGLSTGDQRRNYDVLLRYFNDRGGAGGREIVPVYHRYEATSSQPYAVQEQAACATFTQDQPVFVSLAGGLPAISDGTFNACLHSAGTPVLAGAGQSDQNDDSFARWPAFVQAPTLSLDAIARMWPAGLDETGYFEPRTPTGETRIGLLTYDNETMRRTAERSLKPALAALGHQVFEERYVRQPGSFSDVSDMSAEVQSAVLRFNTLGIQHVLIQDAGNALLTLLFMNGAEGQSYRPRYGLTTNNGAQLLVGPVPAAQFVDSRLVGWLPNVDVPPSGFDEPMGRGRELCDAIYADAGITFADGNARLVAYGQCDEFRVLLAAVEAGSGPLSQATFTNDFLAVGTRFESSIVGPTRFTGDRRYGVARARLAEFDGSCSCFTYTTPWRPVT